MGAKVGPGSPVGAHSHNVGVAVAGAKDMERSEQTGENVRSGDHRAWCWVGCGKTRRAKVMPGLLACLTQTVMVLPTGLVDPGEGQNREG